MKIDRESTFTVLLLAVAALAGCSDSDSPTSPDPAKSFPEAVAVIQGPVQNPVNGHHYYRLASSDWTSAETTAAHFLGGHLVSIGDAFENSFVMSNFANAPGSGRVWLGLSDAGTEGEFVFSDGSDLAYTNWEPGEPNNVDDEDYVAMYSGNGRWVDVKDLANPPGIGNVYGVVEVANPAEVYVVQGPVTNPLNGHVYYRLSSSDWSTAENYARTVFGGHLVSIADTDENNFVLSNFANAPGSGRVWLGLSDADTEGEFVYSDGSSLAYTNWEPGEPNNSGDEDYVAMYSGNGRWVDVRDLANPPGIGNVYGVVEVE